MRILAKFRNKNVKFMANNNGHQNIETPFVNMHKTGF